MLFQTDQFQKNDMLERREPAGRILEFETLRHPTGKSYSVYRKSCQAPPEKIFLFYRNENQFISTAIPSRQEGHCPRSPVRGGMRWTWMALPDQGA